MRWKDIAQGRSQHLYPHHCLSTLMYHITRCRWAWLKDTLIAWFVRRYHVDLSIAAEKDPGRFEHFNAFFTRALKDGVRSLPEDRDALACPADGVISQLGAIEQGQILQAKDRWYSVTELLGGDVDAAAPFVAGRFATIYLSPRDYHRVHLPLDAELRHQVYIPGKLFSVNEVTTRVLPKVFALNERLVMHFQTSWGPMALVMVGAIFVGSMETVWHGQITPPYAKRITTWHFGQDPLRFARGEEVGRFNMGSTVIILLPPATHEWLPGLAPGSAVEVLQALGTSG